MIKATGLPSAYCHFVFAQYKFWGQSEPTTLAPLHVFTPVFGRPAKLLDRELKFDHTQVTDAVIRSCDPTTTQVFTVDVTEDFLDYLEYGTLSVEVYGHRRTSGFINEHAVTAEDDGLHKSFPDRLCFALILVVFVYTVLNASKAFCTTCRCCEVMKNLQLWVGILELNDQGSYVPVPIEEWRDVRAGGVYVLRQV